VKSVLPTISVSLAPPPKMPLRHSHLLAYALTRSRTPMRRRTRQDWLRRKRCTLVHKDSRGDIARGHKRAIKIARRPGWPVTSRQRVRSVVPLRLPPDDTPIYSLPSCCPRARPGFAAGSRDEPNAGPVSSSFEQCEPKGILLGAEHTADEPLLLRSHPITSLVFGNLEMVQRNYRPRRKSNHIRTAIAVTPAALSSVQTIGSRALDYDMTLSTIALNLRKVGEPHPHRRR